MNSLRFVLVSVLVTVVLFAVRAYDANILFSIAGYVGVGLAALSLCACAIGLLRS